MKTIAIVLAGLASVVAVSTPASAAPWANINQRQVMLDQRIDKGVRTGQLNRNEAYRLRSDFRDLARLEAQYRRNGLSYAERADLDRRFDRLSSRIYNQKHDRQGYRR